MNEFIRQTILVAIIVLIIALTTVGVAISNDNTKVDFPPRVDSCPDYWVHASYLKNGDVMVGNSDINVNDLNDECVNIKRMGTCNPQQEIMDFNVAPFNNPGDSGPDSGMCAKYEWAKGCNVTWDGITNKDDICNV